MLKADAVAASCGGTHAFDSRIALMTPTWMQVVGGLMAALLFAYLLVALLKPEKFQ